MNRQQFVYFFLAIGIVIAIFVSGCISDDNASMHSRNANKTNITKTVVTKEDDSNDWFWYYWYGYNNGFTNGVFNSPITSSPSRTYVVQKSSIENGWGIKSPEVVKITEDPTSDTEKISYDESSEEYSQFIEPREPDGYISNSNEEESSSSISSSSSSSSSSSEDISSEESSNGGISGYSGESDIASSEAASEASSVASSVGSEGED